MFHELHNLSKVDYKKLNKVITGLVGIKLHVYVHISRRRAAGSTSVLKLPLRAALRAAVLRNPDAFFAGRFE